MKTRSIPIIIVLLALIFTAVLPVDTVQAASTTIGRKAVRYRTLKGGDNGKPVSVLKVRDQSGTANNPSKYVLLSTPGTAYRGIQYFSLGKAYKPGDVTGIHLRVNFRGPAKSRQTWVWKLYDWNAKRWVKIGDNAKANPGVWTMLVFDPVTSPKRFVNAKGKIRVRVNSNNASLNAKIDFEVLRVNVVPNSSCTVQENAAFEAQVLSLINAERAKKGTAPLTRNTKLDAASARHSKDMACNNFMDHTGSDGSSPWDRMEAEGYTWTNAAENIAAGYSTPASVVAGWMNSSGHRANILNGSLEEIGIAYAYKSGTKYGHYWTTDFGTQP
jgi:uncharacterized protein YkwD